MNCLYNIHKRSITQIIYKCTCVYIHNIVIIKVIEVWIQIIQIIKIALHKISRECIQLNTPGLVYVHTVRPLFKGHFRTLILVLITEVSSIQRSLNTLQYYTGTQNGVLIIEFSTFQRFVIERFHCTYLDIMLVVEDILQRNTVTEVGTLLVCEHGQFGQFYGHHWSKQGLVCQQAGAPLLGKQFGYRNRH